MGRKDIELIPDTIRGFKIFVVDFLTWITLLIGMLLVQFSTNRGLLGLALVISVILVILTFPIRGHYAKRFFNFK